MQEMQSRANGKVMYTGWVFFGFAFPVLLAAWNTGSNLLYIIAGSMCSFLIVSVIISRITLRKLAVTRTNPPNVYKGETLNLELRVVNKKKWLSSFSIRIESADQAGKSMGYIFKLPPRKEAVLNISKTFDKRGVHLLPALELVSSFPFGLMERRQRFSGEHEITVYPRVLPLRAHALGPIPGGRVTTNHASPDGDEFFDLREYVHGDDLRRIAWRVSARVGGWMVRQMSKDNTRSIIFILDTRHPDPMTHFTESGAWKQFEDNFEEAVELVASLMVSFARKQYTVGLVTPTLTVDSADGYGQQKRILEALARVNPVLEMDYPEFDGVIRELQGENVGLLFVTPDAFYWGRRVPAHQLVALNPGEILYA